MLSKKISVLIASALMVVLVAGCGTGTKTNGSSAEPQTTEEPDQDKFQPSIEITEEDDAIIVNYKVKNVSGEDQKLTFTNGLEADYIVYDPAGEKIKQFSDEVSSTQVVEEITIKADELFKKEFTITDLYNGKFKIETFLTAKEAEAKVVSDINVNNSIYSIETGKLVGLMDPHTVEITIEGEATAFQLNDEAQQQLASIQDGEQVIFIYTTENEQKIIEQFRF